MDKLTYKERLIRLNLPTLEYRRYRGDMIEVFKIAHRLYDENAVKGLIEFRVPTSTRGHNFTIYKEKFVKDIKKYSFKSRITDQWNNLPTYVVNSPTLNTFKSRLDKIWKVNDVMFDHQCDIYRKTAARRTRYNTLDE